MRKESRIKTTQIAAVTLAAVAAAMASGCCQDCETPVCDGDVLVVDNFPPSAPDGVFSVTGDGVVTLYWNPNGEPDLAGYRVYYNWDGGDTYFFLAEVPPQQTQYQDFDVSNGVTKYYAVLAFDTEGLESDLSYEFVFDTPRPEGFNLVLYNYLGQNSDLSGYDFSTLSNTAQSWNDPNTDIYFGTPDSIPTLSAGNAGVDVQDYGYVDSLDEIDWAPVLGWSPSKKVELIPGHCYIVRILNRTTGSYNYAKLYAAEVSLASVILDWAYQTDPNNPELSPGGGGGK